jgi:hypothetical protein
MHGKSPPPFPQNLKDWVPTISIINGKVVKCVNTDKATD